MAARKWLTKAEHAVEIHHDALDCRACLHYVEILAKALLETGVAHGRRKNLKADSETIGAEIFYLIRVK
jgi:hypothetical protein